MIDWFYKTTCFYISLIDITGKDRKFEYHRKFKTLFSLVFKTT